MGRWERESGVRATGATTASYLFLFQSARELCCDCYRKCCADLFLRSMRVRGFVLALARRRIGPKENWSVSQTPR
jgi:hypothetical protein